MISAQLLTTLPISGHHRSCGSERLSNDPCTSDACFAIKIHSPQILITFISSHQWQVATMMTITATVAQCCLLSFSLVLLYPSLLPLCSSVRTAAASSTTASLSPPLRKNQKNRQLSSSLGHAQLGGGRRRRTSSTASTFSNGNHDEKAKTRIIGGHDVDQEGDRYPYYVDLRNANDQHRCGGSLIAPDIVLTAAHCL
jgi:Trypsin